MRAPLCICVFAKPPRPGETKTRLIPALGAQGAAKLAHAFFQDTWALLRKIADATLILAVTDRDPAFDAAVEAEVWLQGDGDLGDRMERALRRALERSNAAIVVGSDSPGLPLRIFEQARQALLRADAILGPSEDGGFYLIGLTRCPDGLLAGLRWSQSDTCERTLERLRSRGLRVQMLERWFDVDEPADLERLGKMIARGEVSVPATSAALREIRSKRARRISVVMPVLNEEARIGRSLEELGSLDGLGEVIVVDGGSTDRTVAIARSFAGVNVIESGRGRARQMNAGAAVASGDELLFLHADVSLPADTAALVDRALDRPGAIAGAFKTWTVSDTRVTRLGFLLHLADLRSRYTSLPYGDQAIFVNAAVFRELGGYPDQPLMEDLEFSRRLKRRGRIVRVPANVIVSGRRFLERPIYHAALMNIFPILYRLGVPAATLARFYRDSR
ncbi:MAG TPA: TIGR04283 family arsenosugar biosynthesis glycosyltransferase [Candidatus Binataceae bacterium]|nr:TIGR04283 family arsenosugar biosynthesis glycosyltransferase [Candidatus Binataceae bacterium]